MSEPTVAAQKATKRTAKAKNKEPEPEVIELRWDLAELPSSQHRAGLAGLVMVVQWLERKPGGKRGVCDLVEIDSNGARLRLDLEGLEGLLDDIYDATAEEVEEKQQRKKKTGEVIPPLREVVREEASEKTGKVSEKTFYVYERVVPKGSFLADIDRPADGSPGLWIKLWRDMVWEVLRGIPAQRKPFEARAGREPTKDAERTWAELVDPANATVDLPSTFFIGAQASTAENVGFGDRARFRFLLHFWPFAVQVYCPTVTNVKGERNFAGYAQAIPDVADLRGFCEELGYVLRHRPPEKDGYRPRGAVIDVAIEGGLDVGRRLRERVARAEGASATGDLVLGVDVVHLDKEGNNVRLRSSGRVETDERMIDEYDRIRRGYWDTEFRRRLILNLVDGRSWFHGFDALFRTLPMARFFGDPPYQKTRHFPRDVREHFKAYVPPYKENDHMAEDQKNEETPSTEALIYRVVGTYVADRVKSKTGLTWELVKADESKKNAYEEAREKVAKNAFLAVRSRTGADFVDYFTSTLCSAPQRLGEARYLVLSNALIKDPDTLRTLTLLALSARG